MAPGWPRLRGKAGTRRSEVASDHLATPHVSLKSASSHSPDVRPRPTTMNVPGLISEGTVQVAPVNAPRSSAVALPHPQTWNLISTSSLGRKASPDTEIRVPAGPLFGDRVIVAVPTGRLSGDGGIVGGGVSFGPSPIKMAPPTITPPAITAPAITATTIFRSVLQVAARDDVCTRDPEASTELL